MSLTEKSSDSVSLHSSTHFWIYSVDEKRLLCLEFVSDTFSSPIFLRISQCVWISVPLPVKLLTNQDAIFKSDVHSSGIFVFLLRKEKWKYQSPYKETLRGHGPRKWWGCVFISFYWEILMHQSVSDTKRSKSQKHKFTFISLYNILRGVIWQNYRSE